jgi:hypothetical protein
VAVQGQFGGGKSISTELVSVEIVFGPAPGLCCSNLRDVGAMLGLCCAYVVPMLAYIGPFGGYV